MKTKKIITKKYPVVKANDLYDFVAAFKITSRLKSTFLSSKKEGISKCKTIKKEIELLFSNSITNNCTKFKLNNKTGAKLKLENLDYDFLTDYLIFSSYIAKVSENKPLFSDKDFKLLSQLSLLVDNVLNNYKKAEKSGFIENLRIQLNDITLHKTLKNGCVFWGTANKDEVDLFISIMDFYLILENRHKENVINFLKGIRMINKNIAFFTDLALANFLNSVSIDNHTSKQLLYDVKCVIVDLIDKTKLREQREFEDNKAYTNYRNRKIESLSNPRF